MLTPVIVGGVVMAAGLAHLVPALRTGEFKARGPFNTLRRDEHPGAFREAVALNGIIIGVAAMAVIYAFIRHGYPR